MSHTAVPTPIMLCADDYGLAPGVGTGIRGLIATGRLSATSCMSLSPFWPAEAAALRPLRDHAAIGLHLTLTDHTPLGAMPALAPEGRLPGLTALLKRALTRRLDRAEIAAEFERQFDAFEAAWGGPPDFLDGHHHVHNLPVVRDVVVDLFQRRLAGRDAWVRSCRESPAAIVGRGVAVVRALVISGLAAVMHHRLDQAGIRRNQGFRGVYDFSGRVPFPALFDRFLDQPQPGTLVMCHPGLVDDALRAVETLTDQREVEYRYFLSDDFPRALSRHHARLSRDLP